MKEGEAPRILRPITETQLLWTKQLRRACVMREEIGAALGLKGRATLWTRTTPEATPVFLQATPEATTGVQKIIFSRIIDLNQEGLGDIALSIVHGEGEAPRPDRKPEGHRRELRLLEQDAREEGEREMRDDTRFDEWDGGPDPVF